MTPSKTSPPDAADRATISTMIRAKLAAWRAEPVPPPLPPRERPAGKLRVLTEDERRGAAMLHAYVAKFAPQHEKPPPVTLRFHELARLDFPEAIAPRHERAPFQPGKNWSPAPFLEDAQPPASVQDLQDLRAEVSELTGRVGELEDTIVQLLTGGTPA
jgi:hypothetical protein